MDALWVTLGIIVLGAILLDVFLTALNYDESGFIAGPIAAGQWRVLRSFTRRISRRWRPVALRQVTGLQIMVTVVAWLGGIILGYALIYLGLMPNNGFQYDGVHQNLFGALYFSAAQLATVGTSQLSPNTDVLRVLSIAESLTGVVMISLILTFLLGVYDVISSLRALSSRFFSASHGVGDPIDTLAPFFPNGQSNGLDSQLQSVSDDFGTYADGLRFHHAAYYFQSGRDHFALPYAVRMIGGIVGGLRWGLPTGHPAAEEPVLTPLTFQFLRFAEYLHPRLGWISTDVPATVTADDFGRQFSGGLDSMPSDRWVAEFGRVNRAMADLAHIEPLQDLHEAYDRYVAWLPFAYQARQITFAVSRDLDYQPIELGGRELSAEPAFPPPAHVSAVVAGITPHRGRKPSRLAEFFRRRLVLIDPGYFRLVAASRALLAAVATAVSLVLVLEWTGHPDASTAAIFGSMIAMMTGATSGNARNRTHRFSPLFALIPTVGAVLLSAVTPHTSPVTAIVMAVVAFVGIGIGRFGDVWAALGQLAFVAYYFTLLLNLRPQDLPLYLAAAVVGVLWSFVIPFVLVPRRKARVLGGGVKAFEQRLVHAIDPLVDIVSASRWEPDLRKRLNADMRLMNRSASFLNGQLTGEDPDVGLTQTQAAALRLRVFDVEMAAVNVSASARDATGSGIPVPIRAQLAGELATLQNHVAGYPSTPRWVRPQSNAMTLDSSAAITALYQTSIHDWPRPAKRLHAAILELVRSADHLHRAQLSDLDTPTTATESSDLTHSPSHSSHPGESAVAVPDASAGAASIPVADTAGVTPTSRRAVQVGLSTGLALALGSLLSSTHQYWAAMPAFQVIGATDGETFVKASRRILATILGAAVGFGVAVASESDPAVVLPLLAFCVFASTYFRATSSALTTFWQTMIFALLYEFLGKLSTEAVAIRIVETMIGAAVALLVARLILPLHTRRKLNTDISTLLAAVAEITASCLEQAAGGPGESAETRTKQLLSLNALMGQVNTTAIPLRRAAGSMDRGGIESQLTALWALVYFTRHIATSTEKIPPKAPGFSHSEWERIRAATDDNIAALIHIVNGQLPGTIHESVILPEDSLDDSQATPAITRTMRHVDRLNQALFILMEELTPESGRAASIDLAP